MIEKIPIPSSAIGDTVRADKIRRIPSIKMKTK